MTQTTQLQENFLAAWNAHDLDAIMSMVTDDCEFVTGDHRVFRGYEQLKRFFPTVWERIPDCHWEMVSNSRFGDRGISQWVFTGTDRQGVAIHAVGVDVLTFRGDKICRKDAYRKSAPMSLGEA